MQNSDNAWLLGVTDVMHYSIFDCSLLAYSLQYHKAIHLNELSSNMWTSRFVEQARPT